MKTNEVPEGHTPTALQKRITELLDAKNIPWVFQDTAGGCNVLCVTDDDGLRQVCIHNQEDDGESAIFIVDAMRECKSGWGECAMFGTYQEVWGVSTQISEDPYDFLNIALFLTDQDSDPYEHVLANGQRVADLWG
jgi:hypothetical protein